MKSDEKYMLFLGENVTVNVSSSRIVLQYSGNENNRAVVVAYPMISELENEMDDVILSDDTAIDDGLDDGIGSDELGTSGEDGLSDSVTDGATGTQDSENGQTLDGQPSQEPKPGALKRFLNWFVNIFG
jgi:hypothetical protein